MPAISARQDSRSRLQGTASYQGMNWCRQDFRLACYLRDGAACLWCGDGLEKEGTKLTLDHAVPHSLGGGNGSDNVFTSCLRCNSRRGNRSLLMFAKAAAEYTNHGLTSAAILQDIRFRLSASLKPFRAEAKALIARRGSAAKAISNL